MPVVIRRPGQKIVIPEPGISTEVLKLSNNAAKLGTAVSLDVEVERKEIHALGATTTTGQPIR